MLADIAKLGTVRDVFPDARRSHGSGRYVRELTGVMKRSRAATAETRFATLFESMEKQIRVGYFVLPNGSIQLEPQS